MEDTLTFAPGRPVRDNAELVERAAALAGLAQRPPLTPEEARLMLGVKDRRDARRSLAATATPVPTRTGAA
jgi:uncharacterized protein (DUF849 family)